MKTSKILAIITARGGSKGLHHKNVKELLGKPLLAYSIKVSQDLTDKSGMDVQTVVTTDCPHISEIARQYGCPVHNRPPQLAKDLTPDLPVIRNVLRSYYALDNIPEDLIILHLRPTSPIRQLNNVLRLISDFLEARKNITGITSMRTVNKVHQNPHKVMHRDPVSLLYKPITTLACFDGNPVMLNGPRQLLPTYYWGTGYLDIIMGTNAFARTLHFHNQTLLLDSPCHGIDIDSIEDFEMAQSLLTTFPNLNPFS